MSEARRKYSKEDAVRKGQELFERDIQTEVEGEDPYKFVAIDIETGDYEVGTDELGTVDRLRARRPDAQVWTRRVGSKHVHRIGFRALGQR